MPSGPSQRFDNEGAQWVAAGLGVVITLIGLAGVSQGEPVAAACLPLGLFTTVRGWRSSSVTVEGEQVVTRSIVRTRRFRLGELARVEVAVGQTGMNGFGREHLVIYRLDGAPFVFKELNDRPSGYSVVQQAALAINAGIQRKRA